MRTSGESGLFTLFSLNSYSVKTTDQPGGQQENQPNNVSLDNVEENMDLAFASSGEPVSGFASLVPLLIMGIIIGLICRAIGKRKGKSPSTCFLMGMIPAFGLYYLIWLCSLTEAAVIERLNRLEKSLSTHLRQEIVDAKQSDSLSEKDMECPSCGLINPRSAESCDCGYDFSADQVLE